MPKLGVIFKWLLLIWGAVSLVAVCGMAVMMAYDMRMFGSTQSRAKKDKATTRDVRFVLNGCQLGEAKTEKVIRSYKSERSFTGDHVDLYSIKIKPVDLAQLEAPPSAFGEGWVRGDRANPVIRDAVKMATGFMDTGELRWFPPEDELLSQHYYIWALSIYLHGSRPTAAELIFISPEDDMVFFAGIKY